MKYNPESLGYDMYEFKMTVSENVKPVEFLQFHNNFNKVIDGTTTTTVTVRINFIFPIIHG